MVNTEIRLTIFFAVKDWEALYSQQKQYCILIVAQIMNSLLKFRLKLKTVGKTTRPCRYDLNQIPYDYIVEVTNRLKGLYLIECLKNYGQRFITLYRRQWLKSSPRKKMQKGKMVVWGGLTNSWEKKRSERQRRKEKIYPFKCRVPKNSKGKKESLPQWSVQRNRGKQ